MTNAKPRLALAFGILCIFDSQYWLLTWLFQHLQDGDCSLFVIALCANHKKFQLPQKKIFDTGDSFRVLFALMCSRNIAIQESSYKPYYNLSPLCGIISYVF
jgi:hypothetical protein